MKRLAIPMVLTLCTLLGSSVAQAQTPSQPPATSKAQTAQRDIDPNSVANTVLQMVQLIDRNQIGELWDGASVAAKRSTKREDFIAGVAKNRTPLGAPIGRFWMTVRRQQVTTGTEKLPVGVYASVEFATQFPNNKLVRELVSLRQDEDGKWRFAGYVIN